MRIVQLKAENFRLFQQLSLPLSGRLNLFVGENAAGKTSILEMLYCLNRARSFRGTTAPELAGLELKQWTVFGAIEDRSAERRVGKDCVSTCRSRWSPYLLKKKSTQSCFNIFIKI